MYSETLTVLPGTYNVNGIATKKLIEDTTGDAEYWSNDAEGLRMHRLDFHDPSRGVTDYLIFSPPVTQLPAEFFIGETVTGTGTATYVYPGIGLFPMNYVWTNQIEALETVTVPLGTYPAVRFASRLRLYG